MRDYSKLDAYLDARDAGASLNDLAEMLGGAATKATRRVTAAHFNTALVAMGIIESRRGLALKDPKVRARSLATRRANASARAAERAAERAAFEAWEAAGRPGLPQAAE